MSGSVALATHSGKMGARLAAHTVPDPLTHSAISVAEDVGVVGVLVLAWQHPLIALPILLAVLIVLAWLLWILYRQAKTLAARFRRGFTRPRPV